MHGIFLPGGTWINLDHVSRVDGDGLQYTLGPGRPTLRLNPEDEEVIERYLRSVSVSLDRDDTETTAGE